MSRYKITVCFDNEQKLHFKSTTQLSCYLLLVKLIKATGSSTAKAKARAKYLCCPITSRTALLDDVIINVTRIDRNFKPITRVFSLHP